MTMRCVPVEPTMGQWDDFCKVHSVPFDVFERAYKAMMKDAPPPPADIAEALELAEGLVREGRSGDAGEGNLKEER